MIKTIIGVVVSIALIILFASLLLGTGVNDKNPIIVIIMVVLIAVAFSLGSNLTDKGEEKINDFTNNRTINQDAKKNLETYRNSKLNGEYYSNEFLLNQLEDEKLDLSKRIAFEEILVERGILNFSSTKQNLELISKKLNL